MRLFLGRFWRKENDDDLGWTGAAKVFKVSANWWALILDALHNNLMYEQALAVFSTNTPRNRTGLRRLRPIIVAFWRKSRPLSNLTPEN